MIEASSASPTLLAPTRITEQWTTDPSRLSFTEYTDRCIWGPPGADRIRKCLDRKLASKLFRYSVRQRDNHYVDGEDPAYGAWTKALECGRSYMAGDTVSIAQFLRTHQSGLTDWQRIAFLWCVANPSLALTLSSQRPRRVYEIRKRGEYVEISLPHHDAGGERLWITRDGKTKVLVNVD
jgi:hypothetical protein